MTVVTPALGQWVIRSIGDADAGSWDAFVNGHEAATTYHQYLWRDAITRSSGWESHYLMAQDPQGRPGGVLPLVRLSSLLFGDFLVSMPYLNYGGSLTATPEADAALLEHAVRLARDLGVDHLELRETRPRPGWPVRTDKVAMVLDLAESPDAQFAALGAKLRSQIRRPEREGASVEVGGIELLPKFYLVFARNMRDLGTPVYGRSFFREIMAALGHAAECVVVSVGSTPVAAGLLIHHRETTEIPWASSLREWNRIGGNMLLYWSALKRAITHGSRRFDFGRSTVDGGTYRFKAQWGAQPRPLFWHYWIDGDRPLPALGPGNPKFTMAIRVWQRLPLWLANRIGPPLVRRLP